MYREISEFEQITHDLADEIKEKYDIARNAEMTKLYEKRKKKQKALQKDCSHFQTFTQSWSDYHKGEHNEETYCKTCGKLLSRV